MSQRNTFLIQSSGNTAEHITITFADRTYADEVTKHGYYRNEAWDSRTKDQDFGKVKIGDIILHYCTNDVESRPGQIKSIYEVVSVEKIDQDIQKALKKGKITRSEADQLAGAPHLLKLTTHMTLNRGLELSTIRQWVKDEKLSSAMNNCGRSGFNICRVDTKDYERIVEWNRTQPVELVADMGDILEEELRTRIAAQSTIEPFFGSSYKGYTLYREPDGKVTGELYDTRAVGQIDILYHNNSGDFLVIELKRTKDTADSAVGQIARYVGWVKDNLSKGGKVEGLLVARSASEELKYAVKTLKDCRLLTYELQFKINPAS